MTQATPTADRQRTDTDVSIFGGSAGIARRLFAHTATWIIVVNILLVALFAIISPEHAFWSLPSLRNILTDLAEPLLIVGCMAMLLGAGEFDLSLGSNIILSSVAAGTVLVQLAANGWSVWPAFAIAALVALVLSAAVGACNALIVTRLRVSSLIGTLAIAGVAAGIAQIATGGADLTGIPMDLQTQFGTRTIGGVVPLPILVSLLVFAIQRFVVTRTRYGLRLLAIGSSADAARKAALRVDRHLMILFVIVGAVAGLAAIIELTRFTGTNIVGHQGDALAALSAAVIGGTSLRGGQIRMGGALAGAVLATILQDGLVVVGLSAFYQPIVIGAVLIFAVALDQYRRQSRAREGR